MYNMLKQLSAHNFHKFYIYLLNHAIFILSKHHHVFLYSEDNQEKEQNQVLVLLQILLCRMFFDKPFKYLQQKERYIIPPMF